MKTRGGGWGCVRVQYYSFFNLSARRGGQSMPRPDRFTHRKEIRYPLYRRPGDPQGRSGWVRKICPHRDSISGHSSPYSDHAIPARISITCRFTIYLALHCVTQSDGRSVATLRSDLSDRHTASHLSS